MKDALTTKQLAERWSMNPGTLRNWRMDGAGPRFIKVGRRGKGRRPRVFYPITNVEAYERRKS